LCLVVFVCLFGNGLLFAQQTGTSDSLVTKVYNQQFELREDNDFLHFTDRYYSTGTFLGLRKLLTRKNDSAPKRHYGFYLFQEIYTPSDINGTNTRFFDRPYAGFLGFSNEVSIATPRNFWEFRFIMGITGPWSGAEKIQSLFHTTVAEDSRIATWEEQLATSFHNNLYVSYVHEWQWQPNPFSVHFALNPSMAFGSRDIYVQNDVVFYFGKRNPLMSSTAYKQLGSLDREFFFAIRLGYRYLFHDSIIEGNILGDNSVFVVEPYHQLFLYNFEVFYRKGRNDFKLTYNFETPRVPKAFPHLYVSLTYARCY